LRVTTSYAGKNSNDMLKKAVIARRYDEAIPYLQSGFAQLLCKVGDCFVPRNDGHEVYVHKTHTLIINKLKPCHSKEVRQSNPQDTEQICTATL
jgi:hypothetical protein